MNRLSDSLFCKKVLSILLFYLSSLSSFSQISTFTKCSPRNWTYYYFRFNAKYQVSSESLVNKANTFMGQVNSKINGYITVQFTVNCKGERGDYLIYASDSEYKKTTFDKTLTDKLTAFTKEQNIWKIATSDGQPFDYHGFISFKFADGKITEIIP